MILFIIKKATVIYRVSSFFLFLSLSFSINAQTATDLSSYCFEQAVNLKEVHRSLTPLLLPKDIVEFRVDDNCIDIVLSADRGKLLEKYLSKRYRLKSNELVQEKATCQIDLRTTTKVKKENINLKVGDKNSLLGKDSVSTSTSTMELLISSNQTADFEAGAEKLKIKCQPIGIDNANLIFSYSEEKKARLSTELIVKKGEWVNIASSLKELNNKAKDLGIPQTELDSTSEKNESIYELRFK